MKTAPTDPAFPDPRRAHPGAHPPDCAKGLTVRAYIATQIMACYTNSAEYGSQPAEKKAEWAVQDADALIAELNKEQK